MKRLVFNAMFISYQLFGHYAARLFSDGHSVNTFNTLIHSKARVSPHLFSKHDLFIISGFDLPHYLNHAMSVLFRKKLPAEFILSILFAGLKIIFVGVIWAFSYTIINDLFASILATALILASNMYIGTLNYSALAVVSPVPSFFTIPLAFLVMIMLLSGHYYFAAILTASFYYMYPALAIICSLCLFAALAALNPGLAVIIPLGAIYTAIAIPFMLRVLSIKNAPNKKTGLFSMCREICHHSFLEKHLSQGYGFFGLMLYGCVLLKPFYWEFVTNKDALLALMSVFLILPPVYTLLSRLLRSVFILNLGLFRTTWFIKPVCFTLITAGLMSYFSSTAFAESLLAHKLIAVTGAVFLAISINLVTHIAAPAGWTNLMKTEIGTLAGWTLLSFSILGNDQTIAGFAILAPVSALAAFGSLALFSWTIGLSLFEAGNLLKNSNDGSIDRLRLMNCFNFFLGVSGAAWLLLFGEGSVDVYAALPVMDVTPSLLAVCGMALAALSTIQWFISTGTLPFASWVDGVRKALSPDIFNRSVSLLNELDPLAIWARLDTRPGSMFAVDPVDNRFIPFRYYAERSIWTYFLDINSLTIDGRYFWDAYRRFQDMGANVANSRFFGASFTNKFYSITPERWIEYLSANPIDYVIFDKKRMETDLPLPACYEDSLFIVYDASVCRNDYAHATRVHERVCAYGNRL